VKIVNSIQNLYNENSVYYQILKEEVDRILLLKKNVRWHYESRLKKLESFAMKIEMGRFNKQDIFDDFFAATLVVKDLNEINFVEDLLISDFDICKKRPKDNLFTHKESSSFPFDDLRLYLTLKDTDTGKFEKKIYHLTFELQIKTFLQHAWTIATHDLIYKSQNINWAKERVAYQVKAILEQAEIMISGVEQLSELPILKKENSEVKSINKMIAIIKKYWEDEYLPDDKRRLAQNILTLIRKLKISEDDLDAMLDDETKNNRGANILNLSPYLIVVQSIFYKYPAKIENYLTNFDRKNKFKLLLPTELDCLKLEKNRIIEENVLKI
jgi:ppGpp synthetase/RelA/SpoT-type nucleotidyltranferase